MAATQNQGIVDEEIAETGEPSLFQSGNCSTCRGWGKGGSSCWASHGGQKRLFTGHHVVLAPAAEVGIMPT